jgi:hypothetical protein
MDAVYADQFVELIAGNAKLFGPIGNVGRHFRVDLFRVVRAFSVVVLLDCVGFVGFGTLLMLRHRVTPLFHFLMRKGYSGMYPVLGIAGHKAKDIAWRCR